MVHYRRNRVPGATYFFTVTLHDRRSDVLVRYVHMLREAWHVARRRIPHEVVAVVVLPDHLHAVLTLPENFENYSRLWQEIKKGFTRRLILSGVAIPRTANNELKLWQRRFWEHTIRSDRDLEAHVAYAHFNPVKHGYVQRVQDWPHSSFHRYVRMGLLSVDWATQPEQLQISHEEVD